MVSVVKQPEGDGPDAAEAALADAARRLDGAPDAAAAEAQAKGERVEKAKEVEVIADTAKELHVALTMAVAMLCRFLPDRKANAMQIVWNEATLQDVAVSGAAVMRLHGLDIGGYMGKYLPYLALVGALGPPIMLTKHIMDAPEPKPVHDVSGEGAGNGGQ